MIPLELELEAELAAEAGATGPKFGASSKTLSPGD